MKVCGIYKITNIINGKFYIGSSKDIKHRWREHLRGLTNGTHHSNRMQNSFNKYGESSFKFEIVEKTTNESLLRQIEQQWIDKTKCYDRNIGFNINRLATGGGSYGEDNPNFGNRSDKNPLSKKVAQINIKTLEVIKIWGSIIDITRDIGYSGGNISHICILIAQAKARKKYKGCYWCYFEDIGKISSIKNFIHSQYRKVIQKDKLSGVVVSVFDSVLQAAKHVGVGSENITRCCSGKSNSCCGFLWEYENNEYMYKNKEKRSLVGNSNPRARKIVQMTLSGSTVYIFNSIKEAAEKLELSINGIYQCLSSKVRTQSGGYQWMYLSEYEKLNQGSKQLSFCFA